ncbi:hypothetical protein LZ30DRAFT_780982 [Colletotrichum cereale]|nr:hypothetical protein LZ30DRAFT_780982 [Colletotrichum cereale]
MQFASALAVAASLASAVSGALIPAPINRHNGTAPSHFKLQVIGITTAIHLKHFQAAQSSIFVGLPKQNAECDTTPTQEEATFYLGMDGSLYLHRVSETPQQTFVDRSGMGQGKFGYTTGAQPPPLNGERKGWALDDAGNMTFDGASFIACPHGPENSFGIWVNAGVAAPGFNPDCFPISARPIAIPEPVGCLYTS